jgi:hypothetical protein
MTDLTVINGRTNEPAATVEQIAAFEFKAVTKIAKMSKQKRIENLRALADSVYKMSVIAAGLVTHDKDALVKLVAEKHDIFGPWLMEMNKAADQAQALVDIIKSGEIRLAVALAIVEGPEPPDDDGGDTVDGSEPSPDENGATVAA